MEMLSIQVLVTQQAAMRINKELLIAFCRVV